MVWFILSVQAALAQDAEPLAPAQGCLADDGWPVAGSAGLENSLSALRINAQTYSATRFAEEKLYPIWQQVRADIRGEEPDELPDRFFRVSYEYNANLGVSEVPVWYGSSECPEEYRFSTSPVDVYATNIGGVGRWGRFGIYYSGSFTFGSIGTPRDDYRAVMSLIMYPMLGAYGAMSAPLSGEGLQVVQGSSAFTLDWVGGAMYDGRFLKARGGYVRSRGIHGSIENPQTGLFANGVIRGTKQTDLSQFAAGARDIRWGNARGIGRTSVFTRQIPLTDDSDSEGAPFALRTQHFAQDSIAGQLDVDVTWATRPQAFLHEAWVAYHSPGYHESTGGEFDVFWLLGGGMTRMPAQFYYGLDAEPLITAKAAYLMPLNESAMLNMAVSYNDPATLVLFPFARDAVTIRLTMEGEF